MDRRGYLTAACVSLIAGIAGCLGGEEGPLTGANGGGAGGGTETESEAEPEADDVGEADGVDRTPPGEVPRGNDEPFDPVDDVAIVLGNSAAEEATVRLTVSTDGDVFFDAEVAVPPDEDRTVDPGIHETGRYELEVEVADGPDESYPFGVERYDLEMGSNLIVLVDDEDLRVMIEE